MQRQLIDAKNKGYYIPDINTFFYKYENFSVEHIWVYEFH